MINEEEIREIYRLLKKAHKNQVFAILGYAERIILKNKMTTEEYLDFVKKHSYYVKGEKDV